MKNQNGKAIKDLSFGRGHEFLSDEFKEPHENKRIARQPTILYGP